MYEKEARVKLTVDDEYLATICGDATDAGEVNMGHIDTIRVWLPISMLRHFERGLIDPVPPFDDSDDDIIDLTSSPELESISLPRGKPSFVLVAILFDLLLALQRLLRSHPHRNQNITRVLWHCPLRR